MFRTATFLLCISIFAPAVVAQTVYYVDDNAAPGGDGLSWATAYDTLPPALTAAQPGDQIWVAAGTYVGNFTLAIGVEMYGGFNGTETQLDQRDWTTNETILDGNQTGSVIIGPAGATETTRIDGFTITNGSGTRVGTASKGGGLYLDGSAPGVANNVITDNHAEPGSGGGVYVRLASPTIEGNTVAGNSAGHGGGLHLTDSDSTITDNTVTGNIAGVRSGGLRIDGNSSPMITGNRITDNTAGADCGGISVVGAPPIGSVPTIVSNTITGNSAGGDGGGVCLGERVTVVAYNTIADNIADNGGGLHAGWDSSPTIEYNTIANNSAETLGGGLHMYRNAATIAHNAITGNTAAVGGGIELHHCSATVAGNMISANRASSSGGLRLYVSSATIERNRITRNTVDGGSGAGLRVVQSSAVMITGNTIVGNYGADDGGGLALWASTATIANNTVAENSAENGGGMYFDSPHTSSIANTIVAFNSSGIFFDSEPDETTSRYNCVHGNHAYNWSGTADPTGANGNISQDPLLASPRYGNAHIQPNSPCIDAGNNTDVEGDFDIDGDPRVWPPERTVDIGADESDGTSWPTGPYAVIRVAPIGNDANDGSTWALAKRTVQAGIDAASALGGDVWVRAGTYEELITLRSLAHVYGGFAGTETERDERDWATNIAVLDGGQQGSVVTGRAGHQSSTIDGFTITNGTGTQSDGRRYGGGLYSLTSSPTIANNTITANSADFGGGLYLVRFASAVSDNVVGGNDGRGLTAIDSDLVIRDNLITDNNDGGILLDTSSAVVTGNKVIGNRAQDGGAIHANGSSVTISANVIKGNVASQSGGGLALDGFATLLNNVISGNSAARNGGGLSFSGYELTVANNTVAGNSAIQNGGALYLRYGAKTIVNTIVAHNSSGIYRHYDASFPTLRSNCVYGNSEYDYFGLDDPTGTSGNISVDPLFADPRYGNIHLQRNSPCVDAGNNIDAAREPDIDGNHRIQPLGGTVDIGADESDGSVWPPGPYAIVRVSPSGSDGYDGSSWDLAKRTVQAGVTAASIMGGEVWVRAGSYEGGITLHPYACLYGGFEGQETARDQRNWLANATLIEGGQLGSVVTAEAGHHVSTIDGFTIKGGNAYNGGGMHVRSSSPTIANNTFTANFAELYGAGLYLDHSSATIEHNVITANGDPQSGFGGGLYLSASSPRITGNTLTGNGARFGGAMYATYSPAKIYGNTIADNTALEEGGGATLFRSAATFESNIVLANSAGTYGGGLRVKESSATIVNSAVVANAAEDGGGGMALSSSSDVVTNCTVAGNLAGQYGGGVSLFNSSPTIVNTVVAFNSSGIYRWVGTGTATLRYNCVYGNTAHDYDGLDDPTGVDGNISADPSFARAPDAGPDGTWGTGDDDLGDLRLSGNSPCIDAGDSTAMPADADDHDGDGNNTEALPFDLQGYPRFVDVPQIPDNGTGVAPIIDLGADERQDCNGNGIADYEDTASGSSPDHNTNLIPDECEVSVAIGEDSLGITCTGDEECAVPGAVCVDRRCYVRKNRYISVDPTPANTGLPTARRVSTQNPVSGQQTVLGWVSEPVEMPIAGPEAAPQLLARIVDVPHYRDWSVDDLGQPWVDPTVHVGDCVVSPGRRYTVRTILEGVDAGDEANYSEALVLYTVDDFGDVVGATPGTPPDGVRNFKDVAAVVRGFQSVQTEPKVWLDLQGGTATPEIPDFSDINFADINHAVSGFQGGAYPFATPCDCPGQACP